MDNPTLVQVGSLGREIAEDESPAVEDLSGNALDLNYEDGSATCITFVGPHELVWEVLSGPAKGSNSKETYSAVSPREGVYFIDYLPQGQRATSVSMVVDLQTGCATSVVATLPTREEAYGKGVYALAMEGADRTLVRAQFLRAAVDRPFRPEAHRHVPTAELVGKRVKYVYNRNQVYEHIYMHEKLYAYQCLSGIEKGLGGADRCDCFKIDDQLYLFVWREKVVPTLGVVVIDWRRMKSNGKLFGYQSDDFVTLANAPVAASATLLNVTTYD